MLTDQIMESLDELLHPHRDGSPGNMLTGTKLDAALYIDEEQVKNKPIRLLQYTQVKQEVFCCCFQANW